MLTLGSNFRRVPFMMNSGVVGRVPGRHRRLPDPSKLGRPSVERAMLPLRL